MTATKSTGKSAAKTVAKITLAEPIAIPFDKLVLSQANVRRIANGQSIEELAEDIARRGLMQNLNVRPILDGAGQETGRYEVPAGGRRFRALEHLVKTRRMAKGVKVPCMVREADSAISAEEDSLAENAMHARRTGHGRYSRWRIGPVFGIAAYSMRSGQDICGAVSNGSG